MTETIPERLWANGQRVLWDCHVKGCETGTHGGTLTHLTHADAIIRGITHHGPPPPQPYSGVFFDDRPGVVEFVALAELRHE